MAVYFADFGNGLYKHTVVGDMFMNILQVNNDCKNPAIVLLMCSYHKLLVSVDYWITF